VAPILSFTADEVWQYLPAVEGRPASVHLTLFPQADELGAADAKVMEDWRRLLLIRDEVLKALETDRKAGKIGKGLEAKVQLAAKDGDYAFLSGYAADLKELLNVSQVEILDVLRTPAELVATAPAEGTKCNRCWNFYGSDSPQHVRSFGPWENVCGRCADALTQMGFRDGQ
jgi:isoleucyl-tRNA synthetase